MPQPNSVRGGYPVKRIPDPAKRKRIKRVHFGAHLKRYMIDGWDFVLPSTRRKSARRQQPGSILVLHATKGWRKFA